MHATMKGNNSKFEDIKRISEENMLNTREKDYALEYLFKRRGLKDQGIQYSNLEMAEYLLAKNIKLNIDKKIKNVLNNKQDDSTPL